LRTPDPAILAELDTVSHRPYTTGFYFNENEYRTGESVSATETSDYTRKYKFVGTVLENIGGGRAIVRAQNQIRSGEVLDAISPRFAHTEIRGFGMLVKGKSVDMVQPNTEFIIECGVELNGMDLIRRSLSDI